MIYTSPYTTPTPHPQKPYTTPVCVIPPYTPRCSTPCTGCGAGVLHFVAETLCSHAAGTQTRSAPRSFRAYNARTKEPNLFEISIDL
jgi:hypothetical protein